MVGLFYMKQWLEQETEKSNETALGREGKISGKQSRERREKKSRTRKEKK